MNNNGMQIEFPKIEIILNGSAIWYIVYKIYPNLFEFQ